VQVEFGAEDDGRGGVLASRTYHARPEVVISDAVDDWAAIIIDEPIAPGFTTLPLADAAEPQVGEAAFVIQHPNGLTKRLAYVRNQVSDFNDRVLHYLTDTEGGSSGSPVLNAAGDLMGLHHAGGMPQIVTGRPPLSKNEGIRIPRVLAGLIACGLPLG
jgi:V8-like Glu-specific endopeptidase